MTRTLTIFFSIVLVAVITITGCASAPEKKKEMKEDQKAEAPQENDKKAAGASTSQKPEEEQQAKTQKADEKKKEDAHKASDSKEEADNLRNKNYDGLKYTGPAQKRFVSGVERYFTEGCEGTIPVWKEALSSDGDMGTIAYNIGLCYDRQDKVDEARRWYLQAIQARNRSVEALYNMALLDMRKGVLKADEYERLAGTFEDAVERSNFLAWLYLKTGKHEESIKQAKAALKEDEMNVPAMVTLGTVYFHKEMFELAEMILSTAEQIVPNDFKLQRIYGFLEYKQGAGHKQKATEHFQKAKKINPEMPEISNMLAILAMEIEDFATARKELEFALKIDPQFVEAKINLALTLKGLKEYAKARDILVDIEKSPGLSKALLQDVRYNLAILYLDADVDGAGTPERFDASVEYFSKYLELVDKKDKVERKRIDDYKKEALTERKKLESMIKMRQKLEAKKKKKEEEDRLWQEFLKDAEEAKGKDTIEAYETFLAKYPELDPEDERGVFARKRLEELRGTPSSGQPPPPASDAVPQTPLPAGN
ncbi:MAG TPA: tetratricopeptide repeat protein [bacterium]|nr:tetratricopeptide repeat protein [bacterium]